MEHPYVKDLQFLMFLYNSVTTSGTDAGNLPLVLFMLLWEAQFWNIVLAPFFAAYLPIFALAFSDVNSAISIETTAAGTWDFNRWVKFIVDATTIYIWYWELPADSSSAMTWMGTFTTGLIYDGNLGTLTWIAWLLIPVNAMLFGSWTLILFPVTACILLLNWFVFNQTILDYMNAGSASGLMFTIFAALLAALAGNS